MYATPKRQMHTIKVRSEIAGFEWRVVAIDKSNDDDVVAYVSLLLKAL